MRIGKLAERLGVPAKTIRYYEEIGLLAEPHRLGNGYRNFSEDDCERLRFIRRAKGLGLRLTAIRSILELYDGGDEPCPQVRRLACERVRELDEQIAQLQRLRSDIAGLLSAAGRRDNPGVPATGAICPLIDVVQREGAPVSLPPRENSLRIG